MGGDLQKLVNTIEGDLIMKIKGFALFFVFSFLLFSLAYGMEESIFTKNTRPKFNYNIEKDWSTNKKLEKIEENATFKFEVRHGLNLF